MSARERRATSSAAATLPFRIPAEAFEVVSRAIMVSGATRSGTTMMAQLVFSLDGVELIHEPPFVYYLFPNIETIPGETWKALFEVYLFEDHFMPALAGRRWNMNRHDQSSVFNSKTEAEIEMRLARSHRRLETFPKALQHRCAFKTPEVLPYLGRFLGYFPRARVIVMLRRPEEVIASSLKRRYYADGTLTGPTGDWLFKRGRRQQIPFWVADAEVDEWLSMSEVERTCFAFVRQYARVPETNPIVVVDYDGFVGDPVGQFGDLAELLGCRFGGLTAKVLEGIRRRPREADVPLHDVRPALRREVMSVYDACLARKTPLGTKP